MASPGVYYEYHFIKLDVLDGTDDPLTYPVIIQKCYNIMRAAFQFEFLLTGSVLLPLAVGIDQIVPSWRNIQGFVFPDDIPKPPSGFVVYLAYVTGRRLDNDARITDSEGNIEVFSTALIVEKPPSTRTPLRWEIWSVAANSNYMRAGATKFLMYNIIRFGIHYINGNIYLECDRESFPFITFFDRLMMYYKFGFQVTTPTAARVSRNSGAVETFDLKNIFVRKDPSSNDIQFNVSSEGVLSPDTWISENEFRTSITLLYPVERSGVSKAGKVVSLKHQTGEFGGESTQQIVMQFIINDPSYFEFINSQLASMTGPTIPRSLSHIPSELFSGKSYGVLFHSEYVPNAAGDGFTLEQLPPNVELVIINSPGFFTYGSIMKAHWDFSQKYLQHFTIEQLKLIFKGITPQNGVLPIPTAANNAIPYVKAIQQNLLIKLTVPEFDTQPIIQFHCYSPGDYYPDMEFSIRSGATSTDFIAPIHGVYDITSRYKKADHELDPNRYFGDVIANDMKKYATEDTIRDITRPQIGIPDRTKRVFYVPPPATGVINDNSGKLSGLIRNVPTIVGSHFVAGHSSKIRIFVFSCGEVGGDPTGEINSNLRNAANNYIGRVLTVTDMTQYTEIYLPGIGETLKTALGRDIRVGTQLPLLTRGISNNAGISPVMGSQPAGGAGF